MENIHRVPNMPELSRFKDGDTINFGEVIATLPKSVREKLAEGFDMKCFAKVFEDTDMMRTIDSFLENGMNVSQAARTLYMHRNTLIYRLNSVKRLTGLDLRNFEMATTFMLLHYLYLLK